MSDLKSDSLLPSDYPAFLTELKERIRTAQVKAGLAVNRELVLLYWRIGRDILTWQEGEGWGAKVIERLSHDLRVAFPEMKGFSLRNLNYMRSFAAAYPDEQFVQQLVAQIPWGHNVRILDSLNDRTSREWYIRKTVEHGWSRNILALQIESRLYERQGRAPTNFERTLPAPQSDLAQQILNDPYNFDFLIPRHRSAGARPGTGSAGTPASLPARVRSRICLRRKPVPFASRRQRLLY